MNKKFLSLILSGVLATSAVFTSTSVVNASQHRNVSGSGKKSYNGASLVTGWNGHLRADKHTFSKDELFFTGSSYSTWNGSNPYNADNVTHYDICEIRGTGTPSFSAGAGCNAAGPSVNFGIARASGDKDQAYQYSADNSWRVSVNYSYYATISSWSWMDLFTSSTFRFGSSYYVVNSRVDSATVSRGTIWYD